MSDPKWTPLRHQMLRAADRGEFHRWAESDPVRYTRGLNDELTGPELTELVLLWSMKSPWLLTAWNGDRGRVWTASDGEELLSQWNEEHPEIGGSGEALCSRQVENGEQS